MAERGLSAGIDPYGRLRGWLSANESQDRLLLVTLPASAVPTLYARIGDLLVLAGAAFVGWVGVMGLRARPQEGGSPLPGPAALVQ